MEVFLEFLITAVLSVLLAFGLGLLFSPATAGDQAESSATAVPEADPQLERTKIGDSATASGRGGGGEAEVRVLPVVAAQGSGSDRSGESKAAVREEEVEILRLGEERECKEEEEERSEACGVGVGLGEVSVNEEEIERVGIDLIREGEVEASEVALEKRGTEDERLEVDEVRFEGGLVREIMAEVVGVEKIIGDLVGEEERREMPQEVVTDRDAISLVEEIGEESLDRVAIGEEEVVRSADEEIVLKEGFESEIAGEESADHEKGKLLFTVEDEWEGIEKTELEKNFDEAAAYIGSGSGQYELSRLTNEEQMQLYGLHKVATEGPCYDPRPMALKVSARAQWHAWQRLGNMNPEVAMEQYLSLLSEKFPGWMREKRQGDLEKLEECDPLDASVAGTDMPDLCSSLLNQPSVEIKRKPEGRSSID